MQRLVGSFRKQRRLAGYQRKRDAIYNILVESGFDVTLPEGTFYIFPKSPIEDDMSSSG